MQLVSTQKLVPTIYYDFYDKSVRICQNRNNQHKRLGLANLGLESVII